MPLFYWVATFDKWFTHIAPQSSQFQETGVQKVVFGLDRFIGLTDSVILSNMAVLVRTLEL